MAINKILYFFLLFIFNAAIIRAQKPVVDSLKRAYQKDHQDTTLVKLLDVKSVIVFGGTNTDSALICAREGLAISRRIHYPYGEVRSLASLSSGKRGHFALAKVVTFNWQRGPFWIGR